jgi:arylsulfatase
MPPSLSDLPDVSRDPSRRRGVAESPGWHAAAAIVLAGALLAACGCARRSPPPSLLLITIDTLRADHLGTYGYARPTSPRLDELARQAVVFEKAYATLPRTTQSIATLLTGLYPKHHQARGLFSYLPPGNTTLAEILRERGYATRAVVSNIFLQPGKGFEQGFESYSNPRSRFDGDSSAQITSEALGLLAGMQDRPFFLWVHYLDPHWSYEPEERLVKRFDPDYQPSEEMRALREGRFLKGDLIFQNPLPPRDREHLVARYDAEIAQVDEQIGVLLDGIPAAIRANLLVVLTSDHGESLCEHGYCFAHGETLYDDTLHVPLLFSLPGRLRPERVATTNVSLLDVAPSILRILGLPDRPGMDGLPLLPSGTGSPAAKRALLFAETDYQLIHAANPRYFIPGAAGRWSAVRRGTLKLVAIPRQPAPIFELFDLAPDPAEASPGLPEDHPAGARMRADLQGWADAGEGTGGDLEESLSEEQKERLRSLGYLQ